MSNIIKQYRLKELVKFQKGLQVNLEQQFSQHIDGTIQFLRIVDFTSQNETPRYIKIPDKRYIKEL